MREERFSSRRAFSRASDVDLVRTGPLSGMHVAPAGTTTRISISTLPQIARCPDQSARVG